MSNPNVSSDETESCGLPTLVWDDHQSLALIQVLQYGADAVTVARIQQVRDNSWVTGLDPPLQDPWRCNRQGSLYGVSYKDFRQPADRGLLHLLYGTACSGTA